jgi:hypothetical protein
VSALSVLSGAVLGYALGIYGPLGVGIMRGENPIHRGHYGDWIEVLIIVAPILVGGTLGVLSWFDRLRLLRITAHFLAVVVIGWFLFLTLAA